MFFKFVEIYQVDIEQRGHAGETIGQDTSDEIGGEVNGFEDFEPFDGFRRNTLQEIAGQVEGEERVVQVEKGHGINVLDVGPGDGEMMNVQMLKLQSR
jgi:hypothetical protein